LRQVLFRYLVNFSAVIYNPAVFTAKSEKDLQMQVAQELFADYAVSQEDKRIDFLVYSPVP
jgi:hypothetical protein